MFKIIFTLNWCANESRDKIHFGYAECSQQSKKLKCIIGEQMRLENVLSM